METLKDPKITFAGGVCLGVVITSAAKAMAFLALPVAGGAGLFLWLKKKRQQA